VICHLLTLTAAVLVPGLPPQNGTAIEGLVVNGSQGGVPVAGAEVVLRAIHGSEFGLVSQTLTNGKGWFRFDHLPADPDLAFLPGANRQGTHYPGPRLRLRPGEPPVRVQLTVYDAVASPCPLLAEQYDIDVNVKTGVLEIKEMLVVSNPTLTTFLGDASKDSSPTTLSLAIPDGFERVTFDQEFDGRHFRMAGGHVVTDLPWPPGKRRLVFSYQLPVDQSRRILERRLDLPCGQVRVLVRGENAGNVSCNLPRVAASPPSPILFESSRQTTAAGEIIRLEFSHLSVPWIVSGRWLALALLGILVVVTGGWRVMRGGWRVRATGQRPPAPVS
jgi:hypothetical protein